MPLTRRHPVTKQEKTALNMVRFIR
ncbi:TPA: Rop family plasmid primer RNA-binding protein, partial [Escherichia coli]|nr:Rop family plasmid primer RNA-binding protein [Escherichia coli]